MVRQLAIQRKPQRHTLLVWHGASLMLFLMSCDALSLRVEKGAAMEYEYANDVARCDEIRQMCLSTAYKLCHYIIVFCLCMSYLSSQMYLWCKLLRNDVTQLVYRTRAGFKLAGRCVSAVALISCNVVLVGSFAF